MKRKTQEEIAREVLSYQYDQENRFISYLHQIREVLKTKPKKVLEIGIGNSTVNLYLKKRKIQVISFDINNKLNPDKVGDVRELSKHFKENSFDTVLCAEVLEHIPFKDFEKSIKEIQKITKNYLILSLPHFAMYFLLTVKIPRMRRRILKLKIPFPVKKRKGEHFWEIGWRNYPLKRIKRTLSKYFEIKSVFVVKENPYHRFFILNKRK